MKIVVYTAIFGEIDVLWPPSPLAMDGSEYVCLTDKPRRERGYWSQHLTEEWPTIEKESVRYSAVKPLWDVRVVRKKFRSSRKMARWYKALAHQHFPDADITIWLDGNVRLLIPASQAIKKWLGDADFATFNHQDRNCLYREAEFCAGKGKGNKAKLAAQRKAYHQAGMPSHWGLPETKCVIRRNTAKMKELNMAWWEQLSQHSIRDQVSLPYVCWKLGIRWKVIPGRAGLPTFPGKRNLAFWYARHRKGK
jgi:hypothetical protein